MQWQAIAIPGGGIDSRGKLSPWAMARFDHALEVQKGGEILICLSGVTPNKPPVLDSMGFPIPESSAGAEYLIRKGIRPERILTEEASKDTIGNAWFCRVLHAEPLGLESMLVMTSEFHMERTREAFEWVFGLKPSPGIVLGFEEAPDTGMDKELLELKRTRERKSLDGLRKARKGIRTVKEFHRWLYSEHDAYAAGKRAKRLGGRIEETY